MRMLRIILVTSVFIVGTSLIYPTASYPQNVEELRAEFDKKLRELRMEFESKLREAVAREVARSEAGKNPAAEQPITQLTTAKMPPTASRTPTGVFFDVELSGNNYWGVETDFAARNAPGNVFPQIGPVGRFRTVDVNRQVTALPTLGYYLPNKRGIVSASFYHIDTAESASFRASGEVIPSLLPPSLLGELGFFPDAATAKNQLRINQLDARYQYPIQVTDLFGLTPEVGIRALWFRNSVKSSYLFDVPNDGFNFAVDQRSSSWALGPDIGLAGSLQLSKALSLTAQGKGGYLLGENKVEQVFCRGIAFTSPGCGGAFNFKQIDRRGFPFVEGDFSLTYTFRTNTALAGLSASLGYRIGTVFSLVNRIRDIGDEETGANIVVNRLDLTYDSLYLKLRYLW